MNYPSPLLTIDFALRGGVTMLLLLVAALLVRDHARSAAARLGAAFALGVAAYAATSAPGFPVQSAWWHAPVLALSAGNAIVFWLFARALFDDDFKPHWRHALAWLGLVALSLAACYLLLPSRPAMAGIAGLVLKGASLGFAALAVIQTMTTWRADLVEGRRRLRLFVVGVTAAHIIVNTSMQVIWQGDPVSAAASAANALALAITAAAVVWCLVGVPGTGLFPESPAGQPTGAVPAGGHTAPVIVLDASDRKLIQALEHMMHDEKIYRQEKLTIGDLAAQLGQPEYKLRRLINQGLGYRNFNVFLNRYRIAEAKATLADAERANLSVLTVAMDAGFQSLGPFNRAFKAETGLTPTEFRRLRLAQTSSGTPDSGIG